MNKFATIWILLLTFFCQVSFSQINSRNNAPLLKAKFRTLKSTVEAGESFFNVLSITNTSNKSQSFTVKLISSGSLVPFNLMNNSSVLAPGDSVLFPVRAGTSKKGAGGVAHVLTAEVLSTKGQIINSAHCYVTIPVHNDLRLKYQNNLEYFDENTEKASIRAIIENKGNVNEDIHFTFDLRNSLTMPGAEDNKYVSSVSLGPGRDTIVEFPVFKDKKNEEYDLPMQMVGIEAKTSDTVYKRSVWVKSLDNIFVNKYSTVYFPLTVDFSLSNLLSKSKPLFRASAFGTVMLKKERDIYYYLEKSTNIGNYYYWDNSTMYVGYRDKHLRVRLGDHNARVEHAVQGKGIDAGYKFGDHDFGVFASRMIRTPIFATGGYYEYSPKLNFNIGKFNMMFRNIRLGYSYLQDDRNYILSHIGMARTGIVLAKHHNLFLKAAYSETDHNMYTPFTKEGYSYYFKYNASLKNIKIRLSNSYGSSDYAGTNRGRFEIKSDINYSLSDRSNIFLNYNRYDFSPARYVNDTLQPQIYNNNEAINLQYSINVRPRFTIYAGPQIQNKKTNGYYIENGEDEWFSTTLGAGVINLRYRLQRFNYSISTRLMYGYVNVTQWAPYFNGDYNPFLTDLPSFPVSSAGIRIINRNFKFFVDYYYGPYNLRQQYSYFNTGNQTSYIRINPQYELFVFKDALRLYLNGIYTHDNYDNKRFNLNINVDLNLKHNWSIRALASLYQTSYIDKIEDDVYTYQSANLMVGLRKDFDIPQPRVKYYDVDMVFFKDANGNGVKDENEPGIKNILVNVDFDRSDSITQPQGRFVQAELLTDQYGITTYEKIPNGTYKIKFKPLTNLEEYAFAEGYERTVTIDKNMTYYIPASIPYRITGRIVMHRDEFSALGKVDISNIRITATDTAGSSYFTLTDSKGKFALYIPYAGAYNVKINNIFNEHFDLERNNVTLEFDGFKQFEILFVFDEKKRSINFNNNLDDSNNGFDGPINNNSILKDPSERNNNNNIRNNNSSNNRPVKSFNSTSKSFEESVIEVDTNAAVKYIDKLFEGLDDENDFEGSSYEAPPTNTNNSGDSKSNNSENDEAPPVFDPDGGNDEAPPVFDPDAGKDNGTNNEAPENSATETEKETLEGPNKETIDLGKGKSEETNNEESTDSGEDEIPVFMDQSGITDEVSYTPPPADATEVLVKDDDPNLVPIYRITSKGITFRVKVYKFGLPRFSPYTFDGIKGIICIKDPDGDEFLYYGENYTDYKKAEKQLKKVKKLDFDQAVIQAFKDGNPISLSEAGVE